MDIVKKKSDKYEWKIFVWLTMWIVLLKLDEKESKVQHANITKQTIPFHLEVKIIDFISK